MKKSDTYYNYYNNILDSMLITPTKYQFKVIDMQDFLQIYYYPTNRIMPKQNEQDYKEKLKVYKTKTSSSLNCASSSTSPTEEIAQKNITRSKLSCQQLAKSNFKYWKSFITLTYEDNFTDISVSRNHFRHFIDNIRRVYKDFRYIAITEFQKRGAIHYHLLTDLDSTSNLLYLQDNKFYHIKYWNYGFTSVEFINNDIQKIVGYISKYMTKDIDNRLFGYRRYLYSRNLVHPIINYVDISNIYQHKWLNRKLKPFTQLMYQNHYNTVDFVEPVFFQELSKEY